MSLADRSTINVKAGNYGNTHVAKWVDLSVDWLNIIGVLK